MRNFNKVMLHGNLTADPEMKPAKNGSSVTTFSLATSRDWRNNEGKMVSATDFHRLVAFGKFGEIIGKYFKKGMPVIVSGRLSNRSYLAQDGKKRYITEVVVEDFNFLSRKKKEEVQNEPSVSLETGELLTV